MSNWHEDRKRELLDRYAEEVGAKALARQEAHVTAGRCPRCWSFPEEPHNPLCPNRPEGEEDVPPTQEEGLF